MKISLICGKIPRFPATILSYVIIIKMTTTILSSKALVATKKARLTDQIKHLARKPKLLIIRDNPDPVIQKYVNLKKRFGGEIGALVEDFDASNLDFAKLKIKLQTANQDQTIDGIIIQLPLRDKSQTDELCALISPQKDVDGLNSTSQFLPATVKAILDLLDFYKIDLDHQKIAVVGRGKLVGAPLFQELERLGLKPELFHRGSDLNRLHDFSLIVTATGLITNPMVARGTVLVDAGTASEKGVLRGDLSPALYERADLAAITPKTGGVGPATVSCLFENLLAAQNLLTAQN